MGDPPAPVKSLAAFLVRRRSEELRSIALAADPKLHYHLLVESVSLSLSRAQNCLFFSLHFLFDSEIFVRFHLQNSSFAELLEDDPPLARLVFSQPTEFLRFFDEAAVWAHVRISNKLHSFFLSKIIVFICDLGLIS